MEVSPGTSGFVEGNHFRIAFATTKQSSSDRIHYYRKPLYGKADTMYPPDPARIHLLPAKSSPYVVVIRRKPSKVFHIVRWNTRTDELEHGSWFRGKLYSKRCDVSFDGQWMVYLAMGSTGNQWNGLCRLPFLRTHAEADGWSHQPTPKHPALIAQFLGYCRGYNFRYRLDGYEDLLDDQVDCACWDSRGNLIYSRQGVLTKLSLENIKRHQPGSVHDLELLVEREAE